MDKVHLPRAALDDLRKDRVAVDHQVLAQSAVDQDHLWQGAVAEGILAAVGDIQEVPARLVVTLRYACRTRSMAAAVFLG